MAGPDRATDSLAPYVVGAVAAGALAGLGLRIRNALTYLGRVLSGAWTLVDTWQKVQDDDSDRTMPGCSRRAAWTPGVLGRVHGEVH